MKFSLALISSFFMASVAAKRAVVDTGASIKADSEMGMKLLGKARKLEGNDEVDNTWVAGYSIKFQGCHHIAQWNAEANGEEDVRIATKRLVRFRLCPTGMCSSDSGAGCSSGYGDYIIDMNEFIDAYMENKERNEEIACRNVENAGTCACDNDNGQENYEEYCQYDCYKNLGMDYCVDKNPYVDDENQKEEIEINEYMECKEYNFENQNNQNGRRKLEEEQVQYFLGPYCADQGGKIYMGMFTDEECTVMADDYGGKQTFYDMAGEDLPYSKQSLIGMECMSCVEAQEENNNNNNQNNYYQQPEVSETCEQIYNQAGKCESRLSGVAQNPNENACTYIEGIKIVRKNGTVIHASASKNTVASGFIGIFAVSFILLGAYVYYLKTKLERAKINLSD